jgi:BlaI family penicillinase repressor
LKNNRDTIYTPILERERYTIKESVSLIDKLFNGRITPLVAGFARQTDLKKEDIDELKALIANWEQEAGTFSDD